MLARAAVGIEVFMWGFIRTFAASSPCRSGVGRAELVA